MQFAVIDFAQEQQRDVHAFRLDPLHVQRRSWPATPEAQSALARMSGADLDGDEGAGAGHRCFSFGTRELTLSLVPELLRPVVQPGADLGDDLHRQEVRGARGLLRRRCRA